MTSPSTLLRAAKKAKTAKEAKRLRTLAANMRRDQRAAKAFQGSTIAELDGQKRKHRPMTGLGAEREKIIQRVNRTIAQGKHPGIVVGLNPVYMQTDEAANDSNAARAASPDSMSLIPKKWWESEEQIARLKSVKHIEEFKTQLLGMISAARNDMLMKAEDNRIDAIKASNEAWKINFVSGFMARMNAEAKANGGPLPRAVVVDGVTMARVVDALEKAGYTADGVTGLRRAVGR